MTEVDTAVRELVELLGSQRDDVREKGVRLVLEHVSASEAMRAATRTLRIIPMLVRLLNDQKARERAANAGTSVSTVSNALATLVNFSEDDWACEQLLEMTAFPLLLDLLERKGAVHARYLGMLLSNLTMRESARASLLKETGSKGLHLLARLLCQSGESSTDFRDQFKMLALPLANMTQEGPAVAFFMSRAEQFLPEILRLLLLPDDLKRKGALSIVRNLSFSQHTHETLLKSRAPVLLAMPLIAGSDAFNDEERGAMDPQWLQVSILHARATGEYRHMLLETLLLLTRTPAVLEWMRSRNLFAILSRVYADVEREHGGHVPDDEPDAGASEESRALVAVTRSLPNMQRTRATTVDVLVELTKRLRSESFVKDLQQAMTGARIIFDDAQPRATAPAAAAPTAAPTATAVPAAPVVAPAAAAASNHDAEELEETDIAPL